MAVDALMDADTKLVRALSLGFLFGVWRGECKGRLLAGRERKEYGGRLSPKSPAPAACLARVTKVIPPKLGRLLFLDAFLLQTMTCFYR
jgi:hypothetical protein